MKREEAQAILQREGLTRYNWYGDHPVAPGEMIIAQEGGRWVVSAADERAAVVDTSVVDFDTEEEALDYFIPLVRLEKESRQWSFREIPEVQELRNTAYWLTHPPGRRRGGFGLLYLYCIGLFLLSAVLPALFSGSLAVRKMLLILFACLGLLAGAVFLIRWGIRRIFTEDQRRAAGARIRSYGFFLVLAVAILLRLSSLPPFERRLVLAVIAAVLLLFLFSRFVSLGKDRCSSFENPLKSNSFLPLLLGFCFLLFAAFQRGSRHDLFWDISQGIVSWLAPFFG